jgi:hypothetical protein
MAEITVVVTVAVRMTDAQKEHYVAASGLPHHGGPLRAKDIVDDVRGYVRNALQDSAAFADGGADVSIKR